MPAYKPISVDANPASRTTQAAQPAAPPAAPPESDSDDPFIPVPPNTTCRRRGCNASSPAGNESSPPKECFHHPGVALFHEGSKGWTCCKKRVLEFDEFMQIEGCKKKPKHLFVGSGKKVGKEELLSNVRYVESITIKCRRRGPYKKLTTPCTQA